jgi:uncharacterized Zn finger protein
VTAIAGRAQRPWEAAPTPVSDLRVEIGTIEAEVGRRTVTLTAEPVPPRIWRAIERFAQGRGVLEDAVAGRTQSVHLEHLMAEDWEEPLVPRASTITRLCTCDDAVPCEHVVALAYAVADGIDADPSVLLRWRGCTDDASAAPAEGAAVPADAPAEPVDSWRGGPLPSPGAPRALPPGAVLERLGASGIAIGEQDFADALRPAYAAFRGGG